MSASRVILLVIVASVTLFLLTGCASPTAPVLDPRCVPPESVSVAVDTLPGGVIGGDWTVTEWEQPPECR